MKNLLEKEGYEEITDRLCRLHEEAERKWGTMTAAQMMAHLQQTFKIALSDKPMPRMMIGRIFGWAVKPKLYNESAWKPNLPTSRDFIIKDERDFAKEKVALLNMIDEFYDAGPAGIGKYPHPMFGNFTKEQWGKSMYKHIDHHLHQFGVN